MQDFKWPFDYYLPTSYDNMGCMIEHIHLDNNTFSIPFL
jgi:hypothetical protein